MRDTTFKGTNSGRLRPTMERYGIGRSTAEKIAKACNAAVKIGDARVFLWDRMDRYLAEQADKQSKAM